MKGDGGNAPRGAEAWPCCHSQPLVSSCCCLAGGQTEATALLMQLSQCLGLHPLASPVRLLGQDQW